MSSNSKDTPSHGSSRMSGSQGHQSGGQGQRPSGGQGHRTVSIPIQMVSANAKTGQGQNDTTGPSMSEIEKQMEAEVEKALRNCKPWESKVKGFKQNSLHIRPRESLTKGSSRTTDPRRRRVQSTPAMTNARLEIPEIDVIRREDTSLDTSAESLDEDAKRPLYTECPDTGNKVFRMEFNVSGYSEDNISVKVSGGRLIVHAVQKEVVDGRKTTNEFCRKIKIPSDVDSAKLRCTFHDTGTLVVESPLVRSNVSFNGFVTSSSPVPNGHSSPALIKYPLNQPVVKASSESASGRVVHLHVEVGRVFQSDDVIVKVRGHDKLIISAKKEEVHEKSRLSAQLDREFDLPERILPQSLKAGLTLDGVLKIVAHVEGPLRNVMSSSMGPTNGLSEEGPEALV